LEFAIYIIPPFVAEDADIFTDNVILSMLTKMLPTEAEGALIIAPFNAVLLNV
jgi:hypothetical protein